MADQGPDGGYGSKWRQNWWKYLLIYLVVGGVIYAIVYFVFLRGGGGYGG